MPTRQTAENDVAEHTDATPRDLRLHRVGILIAAIATVLTLAAVSAASVGAAVPDAPTNNDPASDHSANNNSAAGHRAALAVVDAQAVATFDYHAPELGDSPWCAAMVEHAGDWDAFSAEVAAAAGDWATTHEGMFTLVGVTVQSICADTATAFLASTE